jgi:D-alanyl-D-alanine carboxypeptidase
MNLNSTALAFLALVTATGGTSHPASAPRSASPDTAAIDALVASYMGTNNVYGLSLAIAKDGHLVYANGYGLTGDFNPFVAPRAVNTETKFRIASLSKSVTAVAIMRLQQEGDFGSAGLSTTVFGPGSIFGSRYAPPTGYGGDLTSITIENLLEHSAGQWGPEDPMFFGDGQGTHDPASFPSSKYTLVSASNAQNWDHDQLIRYVVNDVSNNLGAGPSQFWKGAIGGYNYSNFNYCLLGRVIEVVTGRTYEEYVRDEILRPMGVSEMFVAGRDWRDLRHDESNYMQSDSPFHYNAERFDAHGGWIASATDLVRFGTRIQGQVLTSATWNAMLTRQSNTASTSYRKGWRVYTGNGRGTEIRGTGSMPGTASILQLEGDLAIAIVMNGQDGPRKELAYAILDLDTDWDAWSAAFTQVDDGEWQVAYTGGSGWSRIGHSGILLNRLRFADFDGNGTDDIFRRDDDGAWYVAYVNGGTSGWTNIGSSTSCDLSTMAFADFDGDGRCDIFKRDADGAWYVKYVGTSGGWTHLGSSTSCDMSTMAFADFNGDGKCDIFKHEGDRWYVKYVGT